METRKTLCLLAVILFSSGTFAQYYNWNDSLSYFIENPAVFEEGQEEGRAYYIPADHLSLNGQWKFHWSETPYTLPDGFFQPRFNDRQWTTIPVPANWEMQGHGDKLFRNLNPTFKPDPPYVPKEYNPTGIYRRTFTVPAGWKDKEIFLRMEKVGSASFVWINGTRIGYNEGAHEPAEYNITPYIKTGANQITVCVLKYSDGYYLEMQDYWRLAGIFDDVTVYAAPKLRLFDYQVITDLDDSYTDATLTVNAVVRNYGATTLPAACLVRATLMDAQGDVVARFNGKSFPMQSQVITTLTQEVKNPRKWSAESPGLYRLRLELTDDSGTTLDEITTPIGFKETEIRDNVFLLNGAPLKVSAQNSHMQHPEQGHYIDEATIRKDFEILKQFNFNAVRTSHYPPTNKYIELADEYGLYIIDEVGDEAHSTEWLSNRPEYIEMYKERCRRLVLRDRNHACVLFWSAGNESGEGENIAHVIRQGKELDPTRYWMYGGNAFAHRAEDIIGPRYPTPFEYEIQVGLGYGNNDRRPSFMDEYLSVAGNGGGSMDDYWKVIYAYPRLIGGAIWDYVSVGVTEPVRRTNDASPNATPAHLMGNASIVKEKENGVLDLNGHDQWLEIYRKDNVEITNNELTLSFQVFPRALVSSCGSFITKGNNQFGVEQRGKEEIEFYLFTNKKYTLRAPLPSDWEYNWHQVVAVYDGKKMSIRIDGEEKAAAPASGRITNMPFPVNIGRNAERHGQETDVYICDARLDDVAIFDRALSPDLLTPQRAVAWFDFETETTDGTYYSYGIGARTYGTIWPDRTVQPEIWEMKKATQPLSVSLIDSQTGLVEVWNRNHFTDASVYNTVWKLMADDKVIQQGTLNLNTAPLSRETLNIPYTKPAVEPGKEYRILVSSVLKEDCLWAKAGHEVAWSEMELDWNLPAVKSPAVTGSIACDDRDNRLTVSGAGFSYTFDKQEGQLISINYDGKEMITKPVRLNFWRAPLANELDDWSAGNANYGRWKQGFGNWVATEMYSAGLDKPIHLPLSFSYRELAGRVVIRISDIDLIGNGDKEKKDLYVEGVQSNGFRNEYEYTVTADGELTIHHTVSPEGRMPKWLPRIGLTLEIDKAFDRVAWYGRGPQANYPDRQTGYRTGIWQTTVDEMYEPYLLPQDYGLRTDNRWLRLTDAAGEGLEFRMNDERFNFNAYPYSTDNLTKANYPFELQRIDGITLNLDYATTGVGCTARSVLDSYRTQPERYERQIKIRKSSRFY